MGKSPAMPPPIWKKPRGVFVVGLGVPASQLHHVLDAAAHGGGLFYVAADALRREHVAEGGVFPAGHEHGQILFGGGQHPAVFRIDLVELLQLSRTAEP